MNRRVPSPWLRPQTGPIVPLTPTRGAGLRTLLAPVAELTARRPSAPSRSSVMTRFLRDNESLSFGVGERDPTAETTVIPSHPRLVRKVGAAFGLGISALLSRQRR